MIRQLSNSENSSAESIERISRLAGGEIGELITVFRSGECQRDLVWRRMQIIIQGGDLEAQMKAFREQSVE